MSDVDNLAFFRIVDKQIRNAMQEVETGMLPVARDALQDTGLPLGEYPVEGYYGKTPELTRYFNHIRTLQLNPSDRITAAIQTLHDFYSNEVFGLGQAVRTAINSEGVWYPEEQPAVISPVVDPLTVAVTKVARNPATVKHDLTIKNLVDAVEGGEFGKGLVGFGVFVDKKDREASGDYNPIATTLARETTVLSAYVPTMRSISQYLVDPEIEARGNDVIGAYNALFEASGSNVRMQNVTRDNALGLNNNLPEVDRCVRIFNLDLPGQPKEFYHWAVGREGYSPKVIDFWRREIITTDKFKDSPDQYQKQGVA
jgi:hypothetical protein